MAGCIALVSSPAEAADWWVDAAASTDGDGSQGAPFASLQAALDEAQAGDTVREGDEVAFFPPVTGG